VLQDIPLLREKVERIVERAGYPANSHAAKAIVNILDNFPRDELLQLNEAQLHDTTKWIFHLQERRRIRLFIHREQFARFYSCIVYVPRERFNTANRRLIEEILQHSFGAYESEFTVNLSESVLARLHFMMRVHPSEGATFDVQRLEKQLSDATRAWTDELYESLHAHFGEARGQSLMHQYGNAFRAGYRENYSESLQRSMRRGWNKLRDDGEQLAMQLYRPPEAVNGMLHFKLFHLTTQVPLSDALPMLENMGFKVEYEHPSKVRRADGSRVLIHDFGLSYDIQASGSGEIDLEQARAPFEDAFEQVFFARVDNDGFNRLVLRAGLVLSSVVILRAYAKYLRQLGFTFSQSYIEDTLAAHPAIARQLATLFQLRFYPHNDGDRENASEQLTSALQVALAAVANLDEDRILRAYLGLILATLRTNAFQFGPDGQHKPYSSLKVDPALIAQMPDPRPMFEIFVYSPRVEGVHLRGGPVARGGLRWSDRPEDFRTEVLGLAKAQQVKNAVIVPVGSKGGFYPEHLPNGDRDAVATEGLACYQTSYVDCWTSPIIWLAVASCRQLLRYDGDDTYLVVAADKGTATFSDFANEIAIEYGFWLGDAFVSGGSVGYDHKGMGITARGAWESVKRHFREEGVNAQVEDFIVVGIGDMSGDVFGNGMLSSRHIRLLGAFNHLHIFVDPAADSAVSFAERERLFKLPRSSWDDYERTIISGGGGVFSRKLKAVALTEQMRDAFGIDAQIIFLTPNELISAMLRAPVDLIWNGDVSTYIKAADERDEDVGDCSNDSARVSAEQLRCRIVGEGGNLGVTQRGRVEFASHNGRINSDAIDNSAGVDCSDHEVNVKVLLNGIVNAGDMTYKQRNELLAVMTEQIGELVLHDNYLQVQALSMARSQSSSMFDVHVRLIRKMESDGQLARVIEFLPAEDEIVERRNEGAGLYAPELSVLMAYVKIELFKVLMDSGISDDAFFTTALVDYFPDELRERYAQGMRAHQLSSEIINTIITNEVVNRAGMTYCFRLHEETGASIADIRCAYFVVREVFDMPHFWASIESLDNYADAQAQIDALLRGRKLCERAARWVLRNRPRPVDIATTVALLRDGVAQLAQQIPNLVKGVDAHNASVIADTLRNGRLSANWRCKSVGSMNCLPHWISLVSQIVRTCRCKKLLRLMLNSVNVSICTGFATAWWPCRARIVGRLWRVRPYVMIFLVVNGH
jgi:glutamate dehydrogenase